MVDVARASMFGFPVGTFRWYERYESFSLNTTIVSWGVLWNHLR